MKHQPFIFSLLLALALCLLSFPAPATAAGESMTILVYMTGSDLESNTGAASADLTEMADALAASGDDSIQIAVLASGAKRWILPLCQDGMSLCRISAREGLQEVEAWPERSMGEASTLADFLTWGYSAFPADRYALILWDHGAGPLMGICADELFQSGSVTDTLTMPELSWALENSPFAQSPLVFIGMDACLMATAEVATTVAPYASYMVASQEPEPGGGWDYAFLQDIHGGSTGLEIGQAIVDRYAAFFEGSLSPLTLSCLDLSRMDQFQEALESLVGSSANVGITWEQYSAHAGIRSLVKQLGLSIPAAYDLIDVGDLADLMDEGQLGDGTALRQALSALIVAQYTNEPYVHGLSIYYPFDNKPRYALPWGEQYTQLAFNATYQHFIQRFTDVWMGNEYPWGESAACIAQDQGNVSTVTLTLSEEQSQNVASARCLIFEQLDEHEYRPLYATRKLALRDQTITASYEGEALYITADDGTVLAGPVTFYRVENGIALPVLLERREFTPGTNSIQPAQLVFRPSSNAYVLTEALSVSNGEASTRANLNLADYADIHFTGSGFIAPDTPTPFSQWPIGQWMTVSSFSLDAHPTWFPRFLSLPSDAQLFAMVEVTDLQSNIHCSPLTKLPR